MSKPRFAICRTNKIKSTKVSSADAHNLRLIDVPHRDPDSDFKRIFGTERSLDSKIKSYKDDGYKIRKDGVHVVEIVMSASPTYFRDDPKDFGVYDEQKMQAWKSKTVNFLKEKYGDKLASIDLHLDESTPHVHAMIIPHFLKEKSKRRTKDQIANNEKADTYFAKVFDAKSLTSKLDLIDLQSEYAEAMKPLGLARGIRKSRAKHTTLKNYYSSMNDRVIRFNSKIRKLNKAKGHLKEQSKAVLHEKENLSRFARSLEEKRSFLESDTETAIEAEVEKRLAAAVHAALKDKKLAVELASKHQNRKEPGM